MQRSRLFLLGLLILLSAIPVAARADDARLEFGLRFNALAGNGEPVNEMLEFGLFGRYRLNQRWRIGVAIDHSDGFDFERPAQLVGLPADFSSGAGDARGKATALGVWLERVYERPGRVEWFWTAGLGARQVDIDVVSGPLQGGGTYTIVTEMDPELDMDEVLVGGSAGLRVRFGQRSALEFALRVDGHIADWGLTDVESGATGRVDDYFVHGLTLGWVLRF